MLSTCLFRVSNRVQVLILLVRSCAVFGSFGRCWAGFGGFAFCFRSVDIDSLAALVGIADAAERNCKGASRKLIPANWKHTPGPETQSQSGIHNSGSMPAHRQNKLHVRIFDFVFLRLYAPRKHICFRTFVSVLLFCPSNFESKAMI